MTADLVSIRRDIHRHPELAFKEHRTALLVARFLAELGLAPRMGVGITGVVADVVGARPGPTLLLRADMDALPIDEPQQHDYSSTVPGVMHACGHDLHTAALLGAARRLSLGCADLSGRVRLVFQPAEELLQGAHAMIADGVLEGVDAALSGHVFAGFPFGEVVLRDGPMMAGADFFEVRVRGRAAHGGAPQLGINPISAAAQLLVGLPTLIANETPPGEHLVVSITAVNAGAAPNVVPEELRMLGSVRWYSEAIRNRTLERLRELGSAVCAALRANFELRLTASVPVTQNAQRLRPALDEAVAACQVRTRVVAPRGASEDFALIAERVPAYYFGVGAGGPEAAPHHCGTFQADERAIGLMSSLFVEGALSMLRSGRAFLG